MGITGVMAEWRLVRLGQFLREFWPLGEVVWGQLWRRWTALFRGSHFRHEATRGRWDAQATVAASV